MTFICEIPKSDMQPSTRNNLKSTLTSKMSKPHLTNPVIYIPTKKHIKKTKTLTLKQTTPNQIKKNPCTRKIKGQPFHIPRVKTSTPTGHTLVKTQATHYLQLPIQS